MSDSDARKAEALQYAERVPGHMTSDELRWIISLAASLPQDAVWVELGVMCGRSFTATALALPSSATLIGVDLQLGDCVVNGVGFLHSFDTISRSRPQLRLAALKMSSQVAAGYLGNIKPNVVFVDADHEYLAVKQDIQLWIPRMEKGGVLCGHDFDEVHWPGVVRAVSENVPAASLVNAGTIWAARIPEE